LEFFSGVMSSASSVLVMAIGLGLVIFVHELGHFAVAKWAGVLVERFSIGFGPVLWSIRRGETEYAFSAIPFGGYVKMLGQDDANPSEMVREDLKLDPKSYPAQNVPKRMAIISAGVIMNMILGFLLFLFVFNVGVPYTPALISSIAPGGPAWQAGIERGDRITGVNGEEILEFEQLQELVILYGMNGLDLEVSRGDRTFTTHIMARKDDSFPAPQIGVQPAADLELDAKRPVAPGTAASKPLGAQFQPRDRITHVNSTPVDSYPTFVNFLAAHADEEIRVTVRRAVQKGESQPAVAEIQVPKQFLRNPGVQVRMGKVTAIQSDSPAESAGIRVGDVIQAIDQQSFDPMRLPNLIQRLAGQEIELTIKREAQEQEIFTTKIRPVDKPAWLTPPSIIGDPLTVPGLGIAYQLIPIIAEQPEAESPAAKAGLEKNDLITAAKVILSTDELEKQPEPKEIPINEKNEFLPWLLWTMQVHPHAKLALKVKRHEKETWTEAFEPAMDETWTSPIRGIRLPKQYSQEMPPQGFNRAIGLGYKTTVRTMRSIFRMLQRLISGEVSPKLLAGPLGIAEVGYRTASVDLRLFIKFLAMLSVNLAIVNFLPIPILDGGHMLLLAWEGIRGKPASERVIIAANYCGLAFILGLALFVTWNDISRMLL